MIYIGLDIGGTSLKGGLVRATGEIVYRQSINWGKNRTGITMMDMSKQLLKDLHEHAKNEGFEVRGVGVSATGQIKNPEGIVIGSAGHISQWENTQIKDMLEESSGLEVCVENDANCAVIAEQWIGKGKGSKNILMYTIGTGIGGGIIINDQLLRGAFGIAGEIGHMTLAYNGAQCHCGMQGCFEKLASMSSLIEKVKNVKNEENIDGIKIFNYIHESDSEVMPIYEEFIQIHGAAITSLLHLLNPEMVIIGGGISAQEEVLIDAISKVVFKSAMPNFLHGLQIKSAQLKNEAGIIGAVRNFIKEKQI